MDIPYSPNLHIDKLAAVFNDSLDNIRQKPREQFRKTLAGFSPTLRGPPGRPKV
ncbi:MAG: hypothetical protein V5A47_12265 [Bacteroidales bacterium]|nr:hypothetical protein [Bacteroidales bacterium]MBS3776046.1 hypothetical protein [Bacteroidales bacterium]